MDGFKRKTEMYYEKKWYTGGEEKNNLKEKE